MEIGQAVRVHSQLAHALLPFWNQLPAIQGVVCSLLKEWETLEVSDEQFLEMAARRLEDNGAHDVGLANAVRHAGEVPVSDYLGLMFKTAFARAKKLYDRDGRWTGGATRFEVYPRRNPSNPGEAPFGALGVSGCTTPGVPPKDACIHLQHTPQLLGPPSWASIPYVLCHELFCHASQAAPSSDVTDPFTEGWMDYVAVSAHERMVKTLFRWAPDTAAEEGRRLSENLRTLKEGLLPIDKNARCARLQGHSAAHIVQRMLADMRDLASCSGERLFQRLSVELNAVTAASAAAYLAAHRSFVSNVVGTERDVGRRTELNGILRKWVTGQLPAAEVLSF